MASYNGNTCVQKENLIEFSQSILEVDREAIENNLINLNVKQETYIEEIEGETWVYLYPFYKAELNITERLIALRDAKNTKFIQNFETKIRMNERMLDIELSDKQREAIRQINDNNICVITGGPRYW